MAPTASRLDAIPYSGRSLDVMVELTEHIAAVHMERFGIPEASAREAAEEAALRLLRHWAGADVYFPQSILVDEKQWAIYQEFNGRNLQSLARKYGMTRQGLAKAIRKMRLMDMQRRQNDLFTTEE